MGSHQFGPLISHVNRCFVRSNCGTRNHSSSSSPAKHNVYEENTLNDIVIQIRPPKFTSSTKPISRLLQCFLGFSRWWRRCFVCSNARRSKDDGGVEKFLEGEVRIVPLSTYLLTHLWGITGRQLRKITARGWQSSVKWCSVAMR